MFKVSEGWVGSSTGRVPSRFSIPLERDPPMTWLLILEFASFVLVTIIALALVVHQHRARRATEISDRIWLTHLRNLSLADDHGVFQHTPAHR